jgi:hypothetical protein
VNWHAAKLVGAFEYKCGVFEKRFDRVAANLSRISQIQDITLCENQDVKKVSEFGG